MQLINLEQTADFFEVATIEQTIDIGGSIVHICNVGTTESPARYILTNDCSGMSSVTPDFFI